MATLVLKKSAKFRSTPSSRMEMNGKVPSCPTPQHRDCGNNGVSNTADRSSPLLKWYVQIILVTY